MTILPIWLQSTNIDVRFWWQWCYSWQCICLGISRARTASCRVYRTSRVRRQHTSCLSWRRPFSWKPAAIAQHHCLSTSHQRRATLRHTELYISAPSRSDSMLSDSTTVSHPTGCQGPTPLTCRGSQVSAAISNDSITQIDCDLVLVAPRNW